ncbi:MAG: MFS transporter [Candidatus Aminicenantes bacterium]|nr:MFS transporter [Candidatus Aminicenantes bacterium]
MAKNLLHRILSRPVDVRPEEISTSLLMFSYFFLITSSAYIIKLVKISDFLDKLSSSRLPYAYLLTAILIGFFVTLNSRLLQVMKRQLYISLSLAFFITCLLIFWLLFTQGRNWLPLAYWNWISMVFWFWADIFLVTSVTQFWILVNDIYNPRQAKRLVGFLVSGGLLGGVAGALLASLSKIVGTENLLLICPFMLVICFVIVNRVHRIIQREGKEEVKPSEVQKKPKIGYGKSFGLLRKNRHLLLLTGIMAVAIVVTTLIDFQFNYFVEDTYPNKDARTAFLGIFFTVFLIFSNLLHAFSTNRILKNFGIRIALLVAPLFLLVFSFAIFIFPFALIYWALIIKGTDKSLAHSLNQSVRELLYIPIPPEIKYKAKVFIDMFVNKFAKGIGALLILLFFSVLSLEIKYISTIAIVFTLIWIILNLLITKEYVNIVKRNLEIKWQDADKFVAEKIDINMTKLVFDTIESKKRSSVLYAMNLFDLVKKENLSSKLKKIISYKSDEVRASSMDSLLEVDGEVLIPETEDSLDEESLDAQVKEIMSLNVYQKLMKDHLDKIVGGEGKEEEVSRMEAAKVMGMMEPTPSVVHNLRKLLRDKSPEVVSYALESAGKLKKRELVPFIIQNLKNPFLQRVASKTLAEYGVKIIGTLKDYLGDPSEDTRLRKAIPDILAKTGAQRAADVLALELRKESRDVESEIISAMYKMRSEKPHIRFREQIVVPQITREIKESYLILKEIYDLKTDKKKEFLAKDLENNLARSLKYIFELLSLIYPQEDIIKAYQNITTGTKKAIDYSIELLDNIVKKEVMEVLLPLIEDIPFEDKVKKGKKMLKILEKIEFSEA